MARARTRTAVRPWGERNAPSRVDRLGRRPARGAPLRPGSARRL